MCITIRRATSADLDAVRYVGFSTWPATYGPTCGPSFVVKGLDEWWNPKALAFSLEHGMFFLAEEDGNVVGVSEYGFLEAGVVLWKLYVVPSHHGQGIGSRLLAEVAQVARERGSDLITECEAHNQRAIAFYSSRGFEQTGEQTSEFGHIIWWRRAHTS